MAKNVKTPAMILQELMVQRQTTPEFNLVGDTSKLRPHDPEFKYSVIAGPVRATGIGRSKKEAKHNAAQNALDKLEEIGLYSGDNSQNNSSSGKKSPDLGESSSPVYNQLNSVGLVKDFCAEKNLPDPVFDLISDIGPSHARQFTMQCNVGTIKCHATSSTKKGAKQLVAKQMLNTLVDTLEDGSNVSIVTLEDLHKTEDKHDDLYIEMRPLNLNKKVVDMPKSLLEIEEDRRKNASELLLRENIDDHFQLLIEVLDALGLKFTLEDAPANINVIMIRIHFVVEYVFVGFKYVNENSCKLALNEAAKEGLSFFKTILIENKL